MKGELKMNVRIMLRADSEHRSRTSSGKRVEITSLSNAERRIHHERGQNSMSRLPLLLQGERRLSERGASFQEHSHNEWEWFQGKHFG